MLLIDYSEQCYDAIFTRHSQRRFDGRSLTEAHANLIEKVCLKFRPFASARAVFVNASSDSVLRGAIGSYGKIRGGSAFAVFIGDTRDANYREAVGYTGEGVILAAAALGVGTCWVGGFFRPAAVKAVVKVEPYESVLAVTPFGYAPPVEPTHETALSGFGRFHRRRPLSELISGTPPLPWQQTALEAARLAPSAVNRQPWHFDVDPRTITVSVAPRAFPGTVHFHRLDCGIAMLHLELGALHAGQKGLWQLLPPPDVGRYTAE